MGYMSQYDNSVSRKMEGFSLECKAVFIWKMMINGGDSRGPSSQKCMRLHFDFGHLLVQGCLMFCNFY